MSMEVQSEASSASSTGKANYSRTRIKIQVAMDGHADGPLSQALTQLQGLVDFLHPDHPPAQHQVPRCGLGELSDPDMIMEELLRLGIAAPFHIIYLSIFLEPPSVQANGNVQLLVRPSNSEDLALSLAPCKTIQDLQLQIQDRHALRREPHEQELAYQGQTLDEAATILKQPLQVWFR